MPIFERAIKTESEPETGNEPKSENAPEAENGPNSENELSASPERRATVASDEALTSLQSPAVDLSRVGEHVAAVLGAAETSANKIREQAEQERDGFLAAAARAKQVAEADAQRVVDEAQAAAQATRAEADRYAEERRREAEIQAAVVIRDGEERAASTGELARSRHAVLLADLAATEARMRDLVTGLRGVAVRLDEVLGGGTASEPSSGGASLDATLAQRVAEGQSAGAAEG
jgi:hypothetical protein